MKTYPAYSRKGLSLIELLVVIAILAAVSGMIVSMTGKMDSRNRYEETARRLAEIRSAVLGPDVVSANGDLLTGGYLQDVGWLPDSPADLLSQPEMSPGTAMPKLYYDSTWRTWAGWKGAYLAPPVARKTGGAALYDDYGNDFYGWFAETSTQKSWEAPRLSGDMAIRSTGSDATKDSSGGGADIYQKDFPAADQPLIKESDWMTNLEGLQVEVTNLTATDFSTSPVQVRFRIIVPRWNYANPLGYWPASPDSDEFIGRSFSLDVKPVGDPSGLNQRIYDFAAIGKTIRVPHGRRMLFLVDATTGQPLAGLRAYVELPISGRLAPPSCAKIAIRN